MKRIYSLVIIFILFLVVVQNSFSMFLGCKRSRTFRARNRRRRRDPVLLNKLLNSEDVGKDDMDIYQAIKQKNIERIRYLVENRIVDLNDMKKFCTPLIAASSSGFFEAVKYFIQKGADVNWKGTREEDRDIAIHDASVSGNVEIVKILVSNGADIFSKGQYGKVPLHCAAIEKNIDVIRYLIQKGANVNEKTGVRLLEETPLHMACRDSLDKDITTIKFLLLNGALINSKDHLGCTPLFKPEKSLKIIKFLVKYGADINTKSSKNKRLIDLKIDTLDPGSFTGKVLQRNPTLFKRASDIIAFLKESHIKQEKLYKVVENLKICNLNLEYHVILSQLDQLMLNENTPTYAKQIVLPKLIYIHKAYNDTLTLQMLINYFKQIPFNETIFINMPEIWKFIASNSIEIKDMHGNNIVYAASVYSNIVGEVIAWNPKTYYSYDTFKKFINKHEGNSSLLESIGRHKAIGAIPKYKALANVAIVLDDIKKVSTEDGKTIPNELAAQIISYLDTTDIDNKQIYFTRVDQD